jgi:hypothetical protein
MNSRWRIPAWSGASIGVVAAALLAWFLREAQQVLRSALRSLGPAESEGLVTGAFWLLFAVGAVLVAIVVAARFHPLISAIPAVWFLIVFGPTLLGVLGTPDWYPDWVHSYFLQTAGEAGPLVTGVLVVGTVAAYVRSRRTSPEPVAVETEESRL